MKKLLQNTLTFLLAVVISLLLAEFLLRIIAPQNLILIHDDIWIPDSTLGWKAKPNADMTVNWGEGEVTFQTDKNGYRIGREDVIETAEVKKKILFIGDSFVQGLQVEQNETFVHLAAQKLSQTGGVPYVAVNAGCSGWNPGQYYLQAKDALSKDQYDFAVVCLCIGDDIHAGIDTAFTPFDAKTIQRFGIPRHLNITETTQGFLSPFNDFLETRSHLYVFLKNTFRNQHAKSGLTAQFFPEVFKRANEDSPVWEDTALTCRFIMDEFERYHTPALFVLLPTEFQLHPDSLEDYLEWFDIPPDSVDLDLPSKLLNRYFVWEGLPFYDTLPSLKQKARQEPLYGNSGLHFNRAGHLAVSEIIARALADRIYQRYWSFF